MNLLQALLRHGHSALKLTVLGAEKNLSPHSLTRKYAMNQIVEQPNEYGFGLEFNYALWTQNTRVTLVNVPWNNDYRDIVDFTDRAALNSYIDSLETSGIVLDNISYLKPNQPIRIDVPFNTAYRYNYLRASNPAQAVAGDTNKDFYYFISDVRYIAPNTTELVLQLDVWQTFGFDINFGNSYIERGHVGVANQNAFDNYGRDYLTIPEGIDYGGEYRVVARRHETVMGIEPTTIGEVTIPVYNYNVLVVSTVDLNSDPGDVDNPILVTAKGSGFEGLASGASIYVFSNISTFQSFMDNYSETPWVTQGIISITLIPRLTRYQSDFAYDGAFGTTEASDYGFGGASIAHSIYNNWRDEIVDQIPERYRHLKKFLTYPYMIIEMTTWTGKPIILKPESWADDNGTIVERASFTPPNQRIEFYPRRYNAQPDSVIENMGHLPEDIFAGDYGDGSSTTIPNRWQHGDDGGDYLDVVTSIANFPTMALVNNGAIGYLASNANSIAFQRQSADWSQSRALASNQTTYDQQKSAIETSRSINALERSGMGGNVAADQLALRQSVAANGLAGVIGGVASPGSMMVGGGMGAMSQVMGGVNANISIDRSNTQLGINQNVSRASNIAATNQAGYVADTNKSLADWAARGDYSNTIAGINAKVQDAQMIQPSTSGQIGGESINAVSGNVEVSLRWKLIDNSAIRVVGEYWLRYGYPVRQFAQISNLRVMTKFSYWKLSETYIISGMMPEFFKQTIRGIFEKGVTVWTDPTFIGNTDIGDNEPMEGITL